MINLSPYTDFETASNEVLGFLHQRLGFDLWMITRAESDKGIVLSAEDHGYDVHRGDVFRWDDSFCSRIVQGLGPRFASSSDDVMEYAASPSTKQVPIGAYVGAPLSCDDGQFFGTLCAIDPKPVSIAVENELPVVDLLARLLATILETELQAQQEHRRAERLRAEALTDELTGLYNRRGWDELLAIEDMRCQRYGHPASVLSVDLDELKFVNDTQGHAAGDALIRRAADSIKLVIRDSDIAARLGGDEFSILAVECDLEGADQLKTRLETALDQHQVRASIGSSMRNTAGSLSAAQEAADKDMYECKRRRKAGRSAMRRGASAAWR